AQLLPVRRETRAAAGDARREARAMLGGAPGRTSEGARRREEWAQMDARVLGPHGAGRDWHGSRRRQSPTPPLELSPSFPFIPPSAQRGEGDPKGLPDGRRG